jgi:DNA-binding NtrC family response regulator
LFIDDDAAVRGAAKMFLQVAGYQVSVAACTAEAVELARQHHDLEAVISDYHLGPGEIGVDAIAAVRAVCDSGLRAVLMSGDTGLTLTDVERGPNTSIASKPINPETLLALLAAPQPEFRPSLDSRNRNKIPIEQNIGPKPMVCDRGAAAGPPR